MTKDDEVTASAREAFRHPQKPTLAYSAQTDPIQASSRFLKKPILNTLRYAFAQLLVHVPFLSDHLRGKFAASAAKRNFRSLSHALKNTVAVSSLSDHVEIVAPFGGQVQAKRLDATSSMWRAQLHLALLDTNVDDLPNVTVSFVTYNSARWLEGLFESLLSQDYPLAKLNVSVVDNGSTDQTLDLIHKFQALNAENFASIVVTNQANVGYGAGHDVSFRASHDDFVFVSNVDLQFHKTSLVRAVHVAMVDLEDVASWELRQCPYEHPKYYDPVSLETSWSSHACVLIRRSAYIKVGGYDKRIFMYGEDVELSYRFRGMGHRTRYLPQIPVTHHVDFSDAKARPDQFVGSLSANILLRHRYGTPKMAQQGEKLLESLILNEFNINRRADFTKVMASVARERQHFQNSLRPKVETFFPFASFDYDVSRLGFDMALPIDDAVNKPLVSVITRTHGHNTQLLAEAIISVCGQTYRNVEHIVVEDRTDFAGTLVENMRNAYKSNIRYIRSEGHGRSAAGNTGLEHSKGAYAMFLDNDDLLFADHIEVLVRALAERPATPAAYALAWEVPTFFNQHGRYREGAPLNVEGHSGAFSTKRLKRVNFLPIQTVLFRREIFSMYGGFDLEIDHLEDWNLWCRYANAGDFHLVPKTTSMYRVPGDSAFGSERSNVMLVAERNVRKKNAEQLKDRF